MIMNSKPSVLFILFLLFAGIQSFSNNIDRLFRFPDIHEEKIVFSYAGDLYLANSNGGTARKITSHVGYEMFPRFSPDGRHIAFTAQYDGNTEVYIMPSEGGEPVRLTYTANIKRDIISDRMGPNNIVMEWSPDGEWIVYRSRQHSFNSFKGKLFRVHKDGGLSEQIPLSESGFCSYSPDGNKLAFNKIFREFRTWKHYRGGMAGELWIYDFQSQKVKKITQNTVQDIIPMWFGDHLFFLSDKDYTMNLYSYNLSNDSIKQLTFYSEYDIKFPSAGIDHIIFENGGYLYKYSIKDKQAEKINVQISNDQIYARNELKKVSDKIKSYSLSPNGKRIVFSARGDIFSVPAQDGITYNITNSPCAHDQNAAWSPDGKYIAYLSDKTGEYEIYIQPHDLSREPVQVTNNAETYKFSIKWSPDSKKILWNDRKLRLRYVDIDTKKTTLVRKAKHDVIREFNWSPDSRWIVYSEEGDNTMYKIFIYQIDDQTNHYVSGEWYHSNNPSFSNDGKYLFFTSARNYSPTFSHVEWNYAYYDMCKIYFIPLSKNTPSPFAPKNIQADIIQDNESETSKENGDSKTVNIDFDNIQSRIIELPVKASNYLKISAIGDHVYYYAKSTRDGTMHLKMFDLEKEKETELGKGMHYSISPKHNKMLVKDNGNYAVIDLPTSSINISEPVDLSQMKVYVHYDKEWEQIFEESWRQMRDFFYVENMHGVDWEKMKEKYKKLVPYANHRDDLTYIIGEMIGELNVGHAYVQSGEKPEPQKINTGLLGAVVEKHSSGYFQIKTILKGASWNKKLYSPLQEIGLNVKEGDYILAINGTKTNETNNIYRLLIGKAGEEVELTINNKPSLKGSHKIVAKPVDDESPLYYHQWVQDNIKKVNEATNGDVGYVHIPDMLSEGLNEFVEYYYPQIRKKALIIDIRGNGGGYVSPMIIERLRRENIRAKMTRNVEEGQPHPTMTLQGPMVMLIDNYTASDGDLMAYAFREHKLGKLIGTRTWGGVVGITGSLPFIDGGTLRKPEYASYSAKESKWIIEGKGVEPDIHVENDPHQEYMGNDAQLKKAIDIIIRKVKKEYKPVPPIPEPPVKNRQQ